MKAEGVLGYKSGRQEQITAILLNFIHEVKDQGTTKHFTLDKDRQS